jgi:hypothetical protein
MSRQVKSMDTAQYLVLALRVRADRVRASLSTRYDERAALVMGLSQCMRPARVGLVAATKLDIKEVREGGLELTNR